MRVRILGCGTSTGVPKIGDDWGKCDPNEPRNYRLRSSILVESGNARVLVDCGPDLRQQLLTAQIGRVDAVVVTHDHGARWRLSRCSERVRFTCSSSRRILAIRSRIIRRSASI